MKHTLMPWKVRVLYGVMATGYEIIQKNDPVDFETICHSVSKNNADHIVQCVNSHDILVKALEEILIELDSELERNGSGVAIEKIAKEALEKVNAKT